MRRLILSLLLIIFAIGTNAQSLEECRRLAREHYPEIRQYNLIKHAEKYNLANAACAWIPQIFISGQATYQTETPNFPDVFDAIFEANDIDMTGLNKDQYKLALEISQYIWDGGQSRAEKAVAKAEAAEQKSRVDVSLYDLQSRVDDLYFGVLLLDERVALTKAQIGILESNLSRMRAYFKNGVAMQSDVDAMEAELLTARQSLRQVESSRASFRRMLELFIGQNLSTEKLERPIMPTIASRYSARPELSLLDAQENKLVAQRKLINSALSPRFNAFAQVYYGYPGMDMFKSMTSAEWTPNAIVGVRMSWNIGALYTRKNELQKLKVAEKQLGIQRDIFLFNTQIQSTQDDGEILRLRKAVEDDDRIVELRRSVRMAAESKLENGVIDATELLQKITDETTAILNRSTHEIELLQATYRLKTILNQ